MGMLKFDKNTTQQAKNINKAQKDEIFTHTLNQNLAIKL